MSRSWRMSERNATSAVMERSGQGRESSPYDQLVQGEAAGAHTIEIRHKATGADGVASTCGEMVSVWYGADDGSDDQTITPAQFNEAFEITAVLKNEK